MDDRKRLASTFRSRQRHGRTLMFSAMLMASFLMADSGLMADQPQWIWTPKKTGAKDLYSQGDCHFRKKFTLVRPLDAELEVAAGDEYEVYINGRLATRGQSYGSTNKMDISGYLNPGVNLIAAKVRHHDGNNIGLALRVRIKERNETRWRSLKTDATWKTRIDSIDEWQTPGYNDIGWLKAQIIQPQATAVVAHSPQQAQPKVRPLPCLRPHRPQLSKPFVTLR